MRIIERPGPAPFRIVVAVHRPRYRGRVCRAAALEGWKVDALLNRQDPLGFCSKGPRPPDILVLSEDFGRQRTMALFRAVQPLRKKGMLLIGLVDDCESAPEGFPESLPSRICDVCLTPPYLTQALRTELEAAYTRLRGIAPPPPLRSATTDAEEED